MGEMSKKVQESRVKSYGHVLRREEEYVGHIVTVMEMPGKRRKGRPSGGGWITSRTTCRRELSGEEAQDRVHWRRLIRIIDPT